MKAITFLKKESNHRLMRIDLSFLSNHKESLEYLYGIITVERQRERGNHFPEEAKKQPW